MLIHCVVRKRAWQSKSNSRRGNNIPFENNISYRLFNLVYNLQQSTKKKVYYYFSSQIVGYYKLQRPELHILVKQLDVCNFKKIILTVFEYSLPAHI